MNKNILGASLLAAVISLGSVASPALADGAASTRNIFGALGAAAAIGITNYNHKKHIKNDENSEQHRRQTSYRDWYYNKYGYYPSQQQTNDWYYRKYGVAPQ